MKLQHLAIGTRFEYEGTIYVKTGPMTACAETGGQKLIPRHAILKSLAATPAETQAATGEWLDTARVRAAFDRFLECCEKLVPNAGQRELADASQRFLDSIKEDDDRRRR